MSLVWVLKTPTGSSFIVNRYAYGHLQEGSRVSVINHTRPRPKSAVKPTARRQRKMLGFPVQEQRWWLNEVARYRQWNSLASTPDTELCKQTLAVVEWTTTKPHPSTTWKYCHPSSEIIKVSTHKPRAYESLCQFDFMSAKNHWPVSLE